MTTARRARTPGGMPGLRARVASGERGRVGRPNARNRPIERERSRRIARRAARIMKKAGTMDRDRSRIIAARRDSAAPVRAPD
ncbi:hypothetical protein [Burkholderia pseudomallei]|uniref:hypothetical protein n=1 Tax=Burkholderia pseudomallei TaxID=28450 RepID=UPI001F484DBE|nr:hypothetical protein [Burkholderia pseudomallei]